MSDVRIVAFSLPVPEPYKSQAKKLGEICFTRDRSAAEQAEREDQFCSQADWYRFVFAIQDDQVIGSVTCLTRHIVFHGRPLFLGGIGGVCTAPAHRRQGIALAMLTKAMDELKDAGCDLAYLCTDVESTGNWLYRKVGFIPLVNGHTYRGKSGKRYTDDDGMIAPVCSPNLVTQVIAAAEPFNIGVGNW